MKPFDPASLICRARGLLPNAHAPYSNFRVAAVAVDAAGRTFDGVNVENAAYGSTMCAERVAIHAAIAAGARELSTLVLTAAQSRPVSPCGACRQVMVEFMASDALVWSDAGDGQPPLAWRVDELLPRAFTPRSLEGPTSAAGPSGPMVRGGGPDRA